MPSLSSSQANELASQFLGLSQTIGDFRYNHWDALSDEEHQQLARQQSSSLHYGEDILALSTVLVMNDVSSSLAAIKDVSAKIKSTLASLADVKKAITITAAIVTLGAAVISEHPFAIEGALESLVTKWKAVS